jgi:virulence-associated protein VagC
MRFALKGGQKINMIFRSQRCDAQEKIVFKLETDFSFNEEAIMHRDGDRLVIEPVRKRGLVALLKSMKPLDEVFPEIDDPVSAPETVP